MLIAEYRAQRFAFVDGGFVRGQIDGLLMAYLNLEREEQVQAFIACQQILAGRSSELAQDLPPGECRVETVARCWRKIASDVTPCLPKPANVDRQSLRDRVELLLNRCRDGAILASRFFRMAGDFLVAHTIVGAGLATYFTFARIAQGESIAAWGWALAVGGAMIVPALSLLIVQAAARSTWESRYSHHWRRELFQLLAVESHPLDDVRETILGFVDQPVRGRKFREVDRLAELMDEDAALEIFSIARRFEQAAK